MQRNDDQPGQADERGRRLPTMPGFSERNAMALLLVVTLLAYLPAIRGGFIWDDDFFMFNPEMRSLHGLAHIWLSVGATNQYYPVLMSAFWLEHRLWGEAPLPYHLLNVLLHALAAYLFYLILRKLKIPGALLAAGIFALHPVMVESVAWISEQKNTLSLVFYLSALWAYLQFDEFRKPSQYAAALGLFLLALLSKTTTLTLPAALWVIFWWQRGRLSWKRDVLPLIPWCALGAAIGGLTVWAERTFVGAVGAPFELSLVQRGLLAGRVVWFYLGKLFWPTNLIFIYPRWKIDPAIWWQWLFPSAVVLLLIFLWAMRKWSRAPLAGWLLFVGTLFPALGFFNVYPFLFSFVADHFQYLASLAMIALAAASIALAVSWLPLRAHWIGNALCGALLAVLATLTWHQASMYSDAATLYQTTIDRNPDCWMAYNNLGNLWNDRGQTTQAMQLYQKALELRPEYPEANNNLGFALANLGQTDKAIEHYRRALENKPNFPEARTNLGTALIATGHAQEAIEQFREAVGQAPNYIVARNNLALALLEIGQHREAIEQLQLVLRLQPKYVDAHLNLGSALEQENQTQEAIQQYQEALQLRPDFAAAYLNLATTLAKTNRNGEASAAAQLGLELARAQGNTALVEQFQAWLKTDNSRPSQP